MVKHLKNHTENANCITVFAAREYRTAEMREISILNTWCRKFPEISSKQEHHLAFSGLIHLHKYYVHGGVEKSYDPLMRAITSRIVNRTHQLT